MSRSRYDEIMRRIAARQRQTEAAPVLDELAAVLDGLNAHGSLEDFRRKSPEGIQCFGPKVFQSKITGNETNTPIKPWIGAILWYKPRGYAQHQTLTLLGIWAYPQENQVMITLGTKKLTFSAPIYNPESYYHHLKRGFDLYYTGDAAPPENDRLYTVEYDPAQRLTIREQIQAKLREWAGF